MAFPQDEQTQAATNYHADKTQDVAGSFNKTNPKYDTVARHTAGTDTSGVATAAAETFTSGTAKQINTTTDSMLYINITTAAALAIAIGPTSSVANAVSVSQSSALGVITLRVPKGWYVKLTGTMSDVTCLKVSC